MSQNISCYKFVISCPSDIKDEIKVIEKVVQNFNESIGQILNIRIETRQWRKHTFPESGVSPQKSINRQLLTNADAVIAVFGNRIGTPTEDYESGTIEEIEEIMKKGNQVFVYFSDKPIQKSQYAPEEEEKIRAFRDSYKNRGIYSIYKSNKDFKKLLANHLNQYFQNLVQTENAEKRKLSHHQPAVRNKNTIMLLEEYCRFKEVEPIVSYGSYRANKILCDSKNIKMDIDATDCSSFDKKEFVMALIKYVPCENWKLFWENEYSLAFFISESFGVTALQLEIKDEKMNKLVDKKISISSVAQFISLPLQQLTPQAEAWCKISEICFTVFLNPLYMTNKCGKLTITDLQLTPAIRKI